MEGKGMHTTSAGKLYRQKKYGDETRYYFHRELTGQEFSTLPSDEIKDAYTDWYLQKCKTANDKGNYYTSRAIDLDIKRHEPLPETYSEEVAISEDDVSYSELRKAENRLPERHRVTLRMYRHYGTYSGMARRLHRDFRTVRSMVLRAQSMARLQAWVWNGWWLCRAEDVKRKGVQLFVVEIKSKSPGD